MIAAAMPWWADALIALCVIVGLFIFLLAAAVALILVAALLAGSDPEERGHSP